MDKRFIIISIAIGVAANVAYELLLRLAEIPRQIEIIVTTALLIIVPFSIVNSLQFRKHGLASIWDARDDKFSLLNQIRSSKKSLSFMGVSARTIIRPEVEAAILQKLLTNQEYEIRFLLFDRNETAKLKRRAIEETGDHEAASEWSAAMGSTIEMILRIKKKLGNAGERLQVRTYRNFPVFRMLILDNKYILMNYYPKNRFPANLPCVEMRNPEDPFSFAYAFRKYFEEMWLEGSAPDTSVTAGPKPAN